MIFNANLFKNHAHKPFTYTVPIKYALIKNATNGIQYSRTWTNTAHQDYLAVNRH